MGLAGGADEDIWGFWPDSATDNLYLSTAGDFTVHGLSGDRDDIFVCVPAALGVNSSCSFFPFWDGDAHGFTDAIYDFVIVTGSGGAMATGNEDVVPTDRLVAPASQIYLPLVASGARTQRAAPDTEADDEESETPETVSDAAPEDSTDAVSEERIYLPLIER